MVWPKDRTFCRSNNGKDEIFKVPRARKYVICDTRYQYTVLIQSYKQDAALPIVSLGKLIYERYSNAEIYYISNKKIRIITSEIDIANKIATDEELNIKYMVTIPFDLCEVKGTCPIPLDYLEEEIFLNAKPKNMTQFGEVPNTCVLTEVRRFQRGSGPSNIRTDINLVSMCFAGNTLPSHVSLDGINYPVNPYREPVRQCRKCWHYKHSDKVCSKKQAVCQNCGQGHDLSVQCQNPSFCINCKGPHAASSKECPIFQRFYNESLEKANRMRPKVQSFTTPNTTYAESLKFDDINFPAIGNKRQVKNKPLQSSVAKHLSTKRARTEDYPKKVPQSENTAPQSTLPHNQPNNMSSESLDMSLDESTLSEIANKCPPEIAEEITIATTQTSNRIAQQHIYQHIADSGKISYIPLSNHSSTSYNNVHEDNSIQRYKH